MTTYKIRKNVKMPRVRKPCRYPFADMFVGDSFLAPHKDRTRVSVAMAKYHKTHSARFASRKVSKSSFGVWRIK